MTLSLVPIDVARFPEWQERCRAEYAADLVETGESPEAAQRHADASFVGAFPSGVPTADNAVFDVVAEGLGVVGYVWVGSDVSEDPSAWWVWDVAIDSEHRGRGWGRSAMELAEQYAREQGAQTLGLSVFGFNVAARRLYESLGYETTSVKMRKTL
ncbi:N-acetyltransferase [Demequina sp. NBRC 110051]|uniref:GNAT family N-acetyltransferase n=1 Tax=Demequina sp. NBRC 110051 TaxID=1570340 RepID=UPI000A001263|nr:GNAT family N-acetyltransferase [Demequina sp. NBRC 110051]